jgi:hypothetical protein
MPLLEIKLPNTIARALNLPVSSPKRQQVKVLKRLLKKARFTEFGQQYMFDEILLSKHPGKKFQQEVPIFDYNKIYKKWWHKTLDGVSDVTWPGQVKFFALSSGTSEAASKYIPITKDLLRGNQVTMIKQLLSLRNYEDIPLSSVGRGWLMLGGSTSLQKGPTYFAGDLSGITAKKVPFWFSPFYKPGKKIARERDWNKKIEEIVEQAPQWDIGFIVGVPSWLQLCMEKIIERYNLKTIHDIWPNLAFFVHGGVSFEPYKKGLERLVSKPLTYIETYLASEGFLAYQDRQHHKGMRLNINQHIFFEFVPFDDENFDAEGNIVDNPTTLMIHEIEENKDYAILISTSAGAWRYLIGDTIKLVDRERSEIIITGRTKHFLSIVGEHLSVDNMTKAVQEASEKMNVSLPEFTVAGISTDHKFAHQWYIACDENVEEDKLRTLIDETLCVLNDDYAVERKSALEMYLKVLPEQTFFNFMKSKGKVGGQHKFPRVLKGKMLEDWTNFLQNSTAE